MVQYLINVSIIWLGGILLYDFLFSRERFHAFNRTYLLGLLAAGLILPAVSFKKSVVAANLLFDSPVTQLYGMKTRIAAGDLQSVVNTSPQNSWDLTAILWTIYLIGLLVGLIFIIRDGILLYALYRQGKKQVEDGYVVIETGKEHGPFSFFNRIFTSSRTCYNNTQWTLLLAHEREHSRKLHSVDKITLIILRLAFWFHPLVHIYYKRLMMVHEYEADKAAATDVATYGHFLLEQNMTQQAFVLTHTLHYSPLKKRIVMLTKSKNTRRSQFRYLTILPLLLFFVLFCTKSSFSEQPAVKENKTVFKGNELEFAPIKIVPFEYQETLKQQKAMYMQATLPDSVLVKDLVNGGMKMLHIKADMMPVTLNGKHIYGNEPMYYIPDAETKYTAPILDHEAGDLEKYIFAQLKNDLDKLPDGGYDLKVNRVVIDDQGSVAYYEIAGLSVFAHPLNKKAVVSNELRQAINGKIATSLNSAPKFTPAAKDGKPVNVRLTLDKYELVVKGHQAQLVERRGC